MENLVSAQWLQQQILHPKLIILDATIPKTTSKKQSTEPLMIKNARFFDIKKVFSNLNSELPNMLPNPQEFEQKAQYLGIHQDSMIVVYDSFGIYSAARVWWMFKIMGHRNVAVLNGGLPLWKELTLPCQAFTKEYKGEKGDFIANFNPKKVVSFDEVKQNLNYQKAVVIDARSKERFYAEVEEPRKGMRSGHIPKSINMPFQMVLKDGKMLPKKKLKALFKPLNIKDNGLIFTCGSGITACILYLAFEQVLDNKKAIYDGSWSEWGQQLNCPISTK